MCRINLPCLVGISTLLLLDAGVIGSARAQKVEFSECSKTTQNRVRDVLRWFRRHEGDVVEKAKERDEAAFSGNSERRLTEMLTKHVTSIHCTQDEQLCGPQSPKLQLGEQQISVPHRYPLTLCVNELTGDETLAGVIAHHVGHHILLHAHKSTCEERCREPSLATLLTETVLSLRNGEPFSLEWCLTACAPPKTEEDSRFIPLQPDVMPLKRATVNPTNETLQAPATDKNP
ncbi:MAG: hypothetical protein ACPGQS_10210 [Bradymonadia bacterium]